MRLAPVSLFLATLLVLGAGNVQATTFVGGTNSWTIVGAPQAMSSGIYDGLTVTFHNNLNVPTQGLVIMVVRDSIGQAIYFTADFVTLNASSTEANASFLVAGGLALGSYNATVFAYASPSGVALCNSTTAAFTL
jgi:hypothetical protein